MADYEDVYAPDLAEETTSTLSGTEQFVMFDSVEGKRGSVNNVGSYILQNGDADGEGHTVAEMIEAAVPRMTKEVTGNPITVDDALGGVDSLTVDLEPVQDLHGYDKPWAPGANKNIINVENPMVFTETKEVVFDEPIPSGETVYIYKKSYEYTTEPSAGPKYPVVVFYNGSTAIANVWINPDGTKSYKLLPDQVTKVVFFSNGWNYSTSSGVEVTITDLVFSLTEEDSYTPYSNVCPITGHDSVTVVDTGKNQLPKCTSTQQSGVTFTVNDDGSISISGTATDTVNATLQTGVSLRTGTYKYCDFATGSYPSNTAVRTQIYSPTSGTYISTANNQSGTAVVSESLNGANDYIVRCRLVSGHTYNGTISPMLAYDSNITTYEAYKSTTKTVTLPHTVYGADVDVTGGAGKNRIDYKVFDGTESIRTLGLGDTAQRFVYDLAAGAPQWVSSDTASKCSCLAFQPQTTGNFGEYVNSATALIIKDGNHIFTSVADFKAWLAQMYTNETPVAFAIHLATPTDLSTTPTDITLYNGDNVVSADGDMDMVYVRDIVKVIEKLEG